MCVIWDYYVDLYVLISLCSNYHVILQKLSGHNVCYLGLLCRFAYFDIIM